MAAALIMSAANIAEAALINGGFETGNFTGWAVSGGGSAGVHSSFLGTHPPEYGPKEGSRFAKIKSGNTNAEYLSQGFSILSGMSVDGWAAFSTPDTYVDNQEIYRNDYARVDILDSSGAIIATPWHLDVHEVGSVTDTPWEQWSWTATISDSYTLRFMVSNANADTEVKGGFVNSSALFDANEIGGPPIPEPASLALLGSGLLGLCGAKLRKEQGHNDTRTHEVTK